MRPSAVRAPRAGAALALLSAALLLAPAGAPAQPRPPAAKPEVRVPADGTELFRTLLDRAGVKPVKEQEVGNLFRRGDLRRDDVVVVVVGDPNAGHRNFDVPGLVQHVLFSGGAALVASDTALDLPRFTPQWHGGGIQPARVRCPDKDSVLSVRADGVVEPLPECPFVVPLTPEDNGRAPDPETPLGKVFAGLGRVATNGSSYIRPAGFGGPAPRPLARFPRGCTATWRWNFGGEVTPQPLPDNALFAVGGDGAEGVFPRTAFRFLALADHSVFINQMLVEPGTENLELAYRVIEYLVGPQKARKRCVFVENGRVVEEFDGLRRALEPPKPPLPMPNLDGIQEKLVDLGNRVVEKAQTDNWLNGLLNRAFALPAIVRFFILLGAVYATWYLLRRAFAARKPGDVPPPPTVPGAPAGPPGVFDRRQKELLRRDNLFEPARALVREFFTSVGVGPDPGRRPPRVVVAPTVRKPDSLRQAVKDFWDLAYGPPRELSAARWREMEPYLDRLRQAHADGKWRFAAEPAPAAGPRWPPT